MSNASPREDATSPRRILSLALALLACLFLNACAARQRTIADTFPQGMRSTPWILATPVWSGDAAGAVERLGTQAAIWQDLEPVQVWIAAYQHDQHAAARLSVCIFAFESEAAARSAFDSLYAPGSEPFKAGDAGCWTPDGVRFVWGRLVFDIFGNQPEGIARAEQAVYLVTFFEKAMPPGLPMEPR